ncbi:retinol dehydrogenase 11 [Hydra vulgaris]|uniref:Retinol dehydrogenase 11 n=1 Tax=Hydra vulgaris TaxID=6087 RepID=A0ABM4D9N9_HYDVU
MLVETALGLLLIFGVYIFVSKVGKHAICTTTTKMDRKTVIITGANTGIGKETALELAKRGATIVLACRDLKKGNTAVVDIKNQTKNENVFLKELDLSSLHSIRLFASSFMKEFSSLHVLINNAGVFCPQQKTKDGFEMHLGVNHLGHFLLTNLLLKHMNATNEPCRIINVTSKLHEFGKINFNDINFENNYSIYKAYSQSKLANILFTIELNKKLSHSNITVYAVHPGLVLTNILRHDFFTSHFIPRCFFKTPKQGAQTILYCATQEGLETFSGSYFAECQITKSRNTSISDAKLSKKLWEYSEKATNTSFPL